MNWKSSRYFPLFWCQYFRNFHCFGVSVSKFFHRNGVNISKITTIFASRLSFSAKHEVVDTKIVITLKTRWGWAVPSSASKAQAFWVQWSYFFWFELLMVELLICWIVGLLDCWIVELLNCWMFELLNFLIFELLNC